METTAWEKRYGPRAALKVLLLDPKNIRKKHIPTATETLEKKGSVAGSLYLYTSGCQGTILYHPGGITQSLQMLSAVTPGGCYGHVVGRGQRCWSTSYRAQGSPTTEKDQL